MKVSLTGRVGIERHGRRVETDGLGRLGRLALAYLVCERRRPVSRDELAEVLWGEALPRTWETSLRVVVSKLRTWLEGVGFDRGTALRSAFGTYQLDLPADVEVDVERAAADLAAAQKALVGDGAAGPAGAAGAAGPAGAAGAAGAAEARAAASRAAEAASGEFLPGAGGAWAERQQEELRDLRLAALEVLSDAALAEGDAAAALAAAEEAAAAEPLRESAHLRVIRAHAALGNRGEALRAYERLRRLLVEELGIRPSPQTEAVYLGLLEETPIPASHPAGAPGQAEPRVRLPRPLSTFVGRRAEVAQVTELLRTRRLVTLVGTGGLGKTRLAVEVARKLSGEFPGGAPFAALGEVTDPKAVGEEVMQALDLAEEPGRTPAETIAGAVAGQRLLLVVDNCEHVVEEAARLVADLVEACPDLVVLATSREALGVAGEIVWRVPPLAPEDANRLFAERAGAPIRPAEDAAVELVCRRLDGIPLAIELAAARTDVLSATEIVARLDDRFGLLTGGARTAPARQQTLRGAVDWSYDLLPEPERHVLQALSVFAGSFTVAAASRVSGTEALDSLSGLVRRSLVAVERGEATRFRLLETIREYAAEKLDASGVGHAVPARLVGWAVELAEEADAHLDGPDQSSWLDTLDREAANLRVALAAAVATEEGLRLVAALGRFWEKRGHLHEGREWLRAVLAEYEGGPFALRARAHNAAAILAQRQGDYAAARSRFEEGLALHRRAGDRLGEGAALHGLGNLAALSGDHAAARDLYERALGIARELGDGALVGASLDNLGWVAHATADFPSARAYYEEALALREEAGDHHGIAVVLGQLGDLAYQQGAYGEAGERHQRSLELRARLGDRAGTADSLATLGHLAMHDGDLDTARSRLEESLAIRRDLGDRAALPSALVNLADLELLAGDLGAARGLLEEAADLATANRDRAGLAHLLVHHGRVERMDGRADEAARRYAQAWEARGGAGGARPVADAVTAEWLEGVGATVAAAGNADAGGRLLGAAEALRAAIGAEIPPHERAGHDRDVAAVRDALGPERFAGVWEAGRSMPVAQALEEAAAALR